MTTRDTDCGAPRGENAEYRWLNVGWRWRGKRLCVDTSHDHEFGAWHFTEGNPPESDEWVTIEVQPLYVPVSGRPTNG